MSAVNVNPPTSAGSAVLQNNFSINLGYLFEPIPVRVARSAVSNTAGGNAYVGAQVGFNVNSITQDFIDSLKKGNFTVSSTASRADAALSGANGSSIGTIAGSNTQNTSISQFGTTQNSAIAQTIRINSLADFQMQLNIGNFTKIGDAENLYVLKKGTVEINGNIILKGVGTLLIEEGTLKINNDIDYSDANASWAFIVKKPLTGTMDPAIIVAHSVEHLSGAYLAMTGDMIGDSASTRPLAVDGNINASIAKLVESRTFIRANEKSTALSTGVTINYSTRAFKNPPPLLSQYLEQYNLEKVSR